MTATDEHIVVCQQIITVGRDGVTSYTTDGHRFPTRAAAIDHGFTLGRSDDFNVATVRGWQVGWFGWMDEQVEFDLGEITAHIRGER